MTGKKVKSGTIDVKALLAGDDEFLRALMRSALHGNWRAVRSEARVAGKSPATNGPLRTAAALAYAFWLNFIGNVF